MLTLYCQRGGRIVEDQLRPGEPVPDGLIWADLINPTAEDTAAIHRLAAIEVPTPEEMREIEPSSRLYREGLALYMTASVLNNTDTPEPETRAITFVLSEGLLTTLRYCKPMPFDTFRSRILSQPSLCRSPEVALVELVDAIVDRIADTLEGVDGNVSRLAKTIFAPVTTHETRATDFGPAIREIGVNAMRCAKSDESLIGLQRMLTFFDANMRQLNNKEARSRIKDLQRDILSLEGYVERMSEKLVLLLDATLGMVNIQQNNIIKIFSVIAVVFLPPTLVASIYGMNFEIMPELSWHVGYPLALIMMFLSAFLPYRYFKHRGWL